jgi:coatomer protein complex subunit alpha (xenin)
MKLLNRQIGVVNFAPLKSKFVQVYTGAYAAVPIVSGTTALRSPLARNATEKAVGKDTLPMIAISLKRLVDQLKLSYKMFQAGKFEDANESFTSVIQSLPLVVVNTRREVNEVKELLVICREYLTAIKLKEEMGKVSDKVRSVELGAYFTHCNLQPSHLALSLRMAMVAAFKLKNFISAASFARRLLELPELSSEKNKDLRSKARKVLQKSEGEGRNEHKLNYDERTPFVTCAASPTPIYRGSDKVVCPFCMSPYLPEYKDQTCGICGLAQIGLETMGLVCLANTSDGGD